jgi:hypothetical protein
MRRRITKHHTADGLSRRRARVQVPSTPQISLGFSGKISCRNLTPEAVESLAAEAIEFSDCFLVRKNRPARCTPNGTPNLREFDP